MMKSNNKERFLLAIILLISVPRVNTVNNCKYCITAVDLSPELDHDNIGFHNENGEMEDILITLKNNGVNTIRIRLWHTSNISSFSQVKSFVKKVKEKGLNVWLTVHYSDTWADPGHQEIPKKWKALTFEQLKQSVYSYTTEIVDKMEPDVIQIGNEIDSGFLNPHGNITINESKFLELLNEGVKAVRNQSPNTIIIIHCAGIGPEWFYSKLKNLDYDIIALSYYPMWHGKDMNRLVIILDKLARLYEKCVMIAEIAYPFTLKGNDMKTNILGYENQILSENPASPSGQYRFVEKIKNIVFSVEKGVGFCYWGGDLVAIDGTNSQNGSVWENQALYDFNNTALPVMKAFRSEKCFGIPI